jgi:hypothetical protein
LGKTFARWSFEAGTGERKSLALTLTFITFGATARRRSPDAIFYPAATACGMSTKYSKPEVLNDKTSVANNQAFAAGATYNFFP